jgi:hypothetical protein
MQQCTLLFTQRTRTEVRGIQDSKLFAITEKCCNGSKDSFNSHSLLKRSEFEHVTRFCSGLPDRTRGKLEHGMRGEAH